jgi:hypothetical protein
MSSIPLDKRTMCAAVSIFAIATAFLYAGGSAILINIGFGIAIAGGSAAALGALLVGCAYLFSSRIVKRFALGAVALASRYWDAVIWAVRAIVIGLTSVCWYSTTLPFHPSGESFLTMREAAFFVLASAIASACVTRPMLAEFTEEDRNFFRPFAHAFVWFVISSACFLVLLAAK